LTELFLSYGADKDIPNNKGETPLRKASQAAFDEVGKLIGRHQQTKDPQQAFGSKSGNILSRMFKRY
jgi:ankyrin repeat protein